MFRKTKFHITERGEIKPCKAKEVCPITQAIGGDHYESKALAREAYERLMEELLLRSMKNDELNSRAGRRKGSGRVIDYSFKSDERGDFVVIPKVAGVSWPLAGDYYFGDLTSKSDLMKLHEADPEKLYQNGECGELANELWNRNVHVEDYYVLACEDDEVFGIHQFVKLKDGSYADSMGIWSEDKLVEHWKLIEPSSRLKKFVEPEGQPAPQKDSELKVESGVVFETVNTLINDYFNSKDN